MRIPPLPCARSIALVAAAAACARPAGAPLPMPGSVDACGVGDSPPAPHDTVRVALLEPVSAGHAPVPANDAERLVFHQLYETLVRIDCTGAVRAGVAMRWHSDGDTAWTFELRPDARFWDGTPIDAQALAAGWRGTPGVALHAVRGSGDGAVAVSFDTPRRIETFGDPAWSVVKRIPESDWPLGTGPVWVRAWEIDAADSVLDALPVATAPPTTPVLRFRRAHAVDPRDLLDGDVNAIVTRDRSVQAYAAARGAWHVAPLAWDRLFVLASPVRQTAGVATQLDQDTRAALARDAVREEARPAEAAAWWARTNCAAASPAGRPPVTAPDRTNVLFPAGDPVARDLAGRLVARSDAELGTLVGTQPASRPRAVGAALPGARLTTGSGLAFVLPVPARPLDPCRAIRALTDAAPWLADAAGHVPFGALAPLVETRPYLLLRGATATADADGTVRLVRGWVP